MKTSQKEIERRIQEFNSWLNTGSQNSGPRYRVHDEDWNSNSYKLPWGMTLKEQGWDNLEGKRIIWNDVSVKVIGVLFDYENYYYEILNNGKKSQILGTEIK